MLLDACHSGGAKAPNLEEDDDPPDAPKPEKKPAKESVTLGQLNKEAQDKLKEVSSSQKPLAILTSCSQDEVSREGKGNGLFTQFMLAGLSGKADKNGDGVVSTKELAFYLNAVIPEETDSAQRPDYNFSRTWSGEKGLPLAAGTETKPVKPEVTQPETKPEVTQPETKKPEPLKPVTPSTANKLWTTGMAKELGVPEKELQPLCHTNAGQVILDMSGAEWQKLGAAKQNSYAKAYQKAYAAQIGVSIETPYKIDEEVSTAMVLAPPGRFLMGSPTSENGRKEAYEKQHVVVISKPFWIGKYEVTLAQWKAATGDDKAISGEKDENLPAHVSWSDADTFVYHTETKVPTEAQWEYACRAGTTSAFNLGKVLKPKQVRFTTPEGSRPRVAVGSLDNANNWGAYDFHGNAKEWCQDVYDKYPNKKEFVDPFVPPDPTDLDRKQRVLRGGSFYSPEEGCRSAIRYEGRVDNSAYIDYGLRIVRDVWSESPLANDHAKPPAKAGNDWGTIMAVEAGISMQVLETMICQVSGKKLLDMASDNWFKLHYREQMKLAAAYQKAYAKTLGLDVEKACEAGEVKILLRLIPPGRYRMGSPLNEGGRNNHDKECHIVTLTKPFWVSKYEVTDGQWESVMNGKTLEQGKADMVVSYVSQHDCRKFCERADMRLLTEAEWEYACRAGTTTPFNLGRQLDPEVVNYNASTLYRSSKEGKRKRATILAAGTFANTNAWGCCDFHGNVAEVCEDAYEYNNSAKEVTDPLPNAKDPSSCVVRGGHYFLPATACRSASRASGMSDRAGSYTGFRVAVTVDVK
jgi:formylglycine-generating enzyme required for sulfatase activity